MNETEFYLRISEILKSARNKVAQAVNITMVETYFEIGRLIVDQEQKGKGRAEYGQQLIETLSEKLSFEFGRGFSSTNVKQMKSFYQIYSKGQTASD